MSRRSLVCLIVGLLLGGVVGGGVSLVAASTGDVVTLCANKKTGVIRYLKSSKCGRSETRLDVNQSGQIGATGVAGPRGEVGPTGAAGAKGDTGAQGPKGDVGPRGEPGPAGSTSPTGFTARSVCGADGATSCVIGAQGPGGGEIFFIDTENEIEGYDYLEVAPTDAVASALVAWSTTTTKCGVGADTSCQLSYISTAGDALSRLRLNSRDEATNEVVTRHRAGVVDASEYAAGAADSFATSTASDWFLPTKEQLNELCKYARNLPTGNTSVVCGRSGTLRDGFAGVTYWSSSEGSATGAWSQNFVFGFQFTDLKSNALTVRPVRGF